MKKEAPRNTKSRRLANTKKKAGSGYRLTRWIILGLLAIIVLSGYGYLTRSPDPQTIRIASGPFRSDSYELMREVADVVSRHSDWLKIEVIATRDSSRNTTLLNEGKVEAATIRSDTPVASNVRLVADLFPDYFQILTRRDKPVFKVKNLVGKRVAVPRFGTDEFRSFWIIGDHYDLPINGMQWQALDFETAADKLLDGSVDAIFTVRSLRDRLLLNLFADAELKSLALRFVDIDQAEAIALKRPFLGVGTVPMGAFVGRNPVPFVDTITSTVDRLLVTREDMPEETAREITRILFEHRFDLTIRFSLASAIKQPNFTVGSPIALHAGAEQYYTRDEPSFIQENAEPLALLVTVFALLSSSLFAMRSRWEATQKNRMDSYNYTLLDIAEKARNSNDIAALKNMRNELFGQLEHVVIALDNDAVTEEGFQSFSLLWESVKEVVNDRITELNEASFKS
ncbi:MAG: TAXI family TRAP transporter solute-binding subunit [Rhizobiaceae bacterium]|nr:TAXI family TRAP transporter solute-binding subunit [Rhizobiaceae bacterium]